MAIHTLPSHSAKPQSILTRRNLLAMALATNSTSSFSLADPAVLKVSGKIIKHNSADGKSYTLTFSELSRLANTTITSSTQYAEKGVFQGPLLRDVLRLVGLAKDASSVDVVAIDEYQRNIPISDFTKWNVILAHTWNGRRLTVENKGPFWVMYPLDQYPKELQNSETSMKLVWSLVGLVVR